MEKVRFFSLMEVMIVLLIVSLIAGISNFSILPFYQTYRFRMEVDTIYELVSELQLEAMALQSDMKIDFRQKNQQWEAVSSTDETVIKSQTIYLPHVKRIEMSLPMTLTLSSTGQIYPKSTISFIHRNEVRGLDLTHPPFIKLWIQSPPNWNDPDIPNLQTLK